jgi:hypothetical protein
MYTLIKKDFLIQKRNLFLSAFIAVLFLAAWSNVSLMFSVIMVSYMLVFGASAYEDKYNSDKLLASLPISKTKIVFAKYLSVYVFAAYALVLNGLIIAVFDVLKLPITIPPLTWQVILAAAGILTVYTSIALPIIFKYGYTRSRMITFILIFVLMFGFGNAQLDTLLPTSESSRLIVLIIGVLLLLAVSVWISLHIYRRREF